MMKTEKRKVVFIVPTLTAKGPMQVLLNILKELDRSEFNPEIVCLYRPKGDNNAFIKKFEDLNVKIHWFSYGFKDMFLKPKSIARKIEGMYAGQDVVYHAHSYFPTVIGKYLRTNRKTNTIHNIASEDYVLKFGKVLGNWMTRTFKKSLGRYPKSVVISRCMRDYYGKDKSLGLEVIYNGVSENFPIPSDKSMKSLRENLGIPEGVTTFLYPATFNKRKNHRFFIDAVKNLKRDGFMVLFAGSGELFDECKAQAAGDSRIRFLGQCSNMDELWALSDIMISTSQSEGLPMAVLEALLHGRGCLLSNIPSHREIAEVIGDKDVKIFELSSPDQLTEAIEAVLDDHTPSEDLAQRAGKHFGASAMTRKYMELYKNL